MSRKIILLVLMTVSLAASAQDSAFLSRVVNAVAGQPVQEKVYLHLNKPSYYPGDTIWYKAYTVTSKRHRLSSLSGVLYAELISPADSVISRQTLRLTAGIGWGEFALPRKTRGGIYHVRAYTNWMRNAGADHFFNQRVMVLGPGLMDARLSASVRQAGVKRTDEHPDIQFLPEGGDLVAGLRSRVAFKAVGSNGLGVDISGTIVDNGGNVVADFTSQHLGMGVFALTPQPGKTYHAKIAVPGEESFSVDLPGAVAAGFTLSVDNHEKDSIYVRIAANDKLFGAAAGSKFYLVGEAEGKVYYTTLGQLTQPVFVARVERSRFPSGIVQFTLFSKDERPVNERAIFVSNNDMMKLGVSGVGASCTSRQKVQISLSTDTLSSLSVSVINENRAPFNENNESTILNHLLLTSNLGGYIEQPNYYFTEVTDQKLADLDVLMLTQGYTRFKWDNVLSGDLPPVTYAQENGLQLEGTLKTPSGKPVAKGKVTLVSTRDNTVMDTVTDLNGNFIFTGLNFSDTSKIVLRARKANNGSNVNIYVKQPDYPPVIEDKIGGETSMPLTESMAAVAGYRQEQVNDSLKDGRVLNEVTIKGKKTVKPDVYNHYGTVREDVVNMKTLNNEFVRVKDGVIILVPGLHYIYGRNGLPKLVYEHDTAAVRIIVDGFQRPQADIDTYSPKEIESIRLVHSTFIDPATLIITSRNYAGTDASTAIKLKMVTIKARKEKPKPDLSNSSNFHGPGNADQVIMYDELGYGPDLSDRLTGKVNGVIFNNKGYPINISGGFMSVIVDGMVLDHAHINDIIASDVYSIEVLRSGAARSVYGSSIEHGGALVITTKRGVPTDAAKAPIKLKTVTINAKKAKPKPSLQFSSNLNGPGHANQVVMGDDLSPGCINLSDCLSGRLAGIYINSGVPYLQRAQGRLSGLPAMTVIVDGMVMDGTHLNDVSPTDIYSIEVLRSGGYLAIYGSSAPGGAIIITTRRGGEPKGDSKYVTSIVPAGLITYPFHGFHVARLFYSPKYDHPKTDRDRFDPRSAIYWNPNIITGKDGKASFEYYNADTKGTYRVVVEGIDENGKIGRAVYRYAVQ